MNRLLLFVIGCVSRVAMAQNQPLLTPHPIEVLTSDVTPAQVDAIQSEYRRQLTMAKVQIPSKTKIDGFMAQLNRKDCGRVDDCLKELATIGKSLYALSVVVAREVDGTMVLTGRVVRDDGKLFVGPLTKKQTRSGSETVDQTTARVVEAFLAEARLGDLPLTREAVGVPAVSSDAGVAAGGTPDGGQMNWTPPPPPPVEPSGLKTAGTVSLIGGAGVAVIGVILFGTGANIAGGLGVSDGAVPRANVAKAVTANTLQGAGLTVGLVGLVAAGAGTLMLMMAPDEAKRPTISIVPVAGGSVVMIGGSL